MPDTSDWTSDRAGSEQPNDLGSCVTALANEVSKAMEEEVKPFGINPIEFALLRTCRFTGTTTARDLDTVLPVDRSRISGIVDNLVERGFVQRRRSRADRRVVRLQLTGEGKELIDDLIQRVDARNSAMLAGVTPAEMSSFISTTRKVLANCAPK